MLNKLIIPGAVLAVAIFATAEDSKKQSGPLHPEMKVAADAGSYQKPMGTMGEKSGEVWTSTTVAAGVNGKPEPGRPVTVAGEIIDLSCYLQLGKHGEKHVPCGKKCLAAGQPIGLLAKDGTVYMLMAEEHDPRRDGQTEGFRKAAIDHLGHIMQVTGTEANLRGYRAIYIQGHVNK
jgi:hypothetical protein